MPVKYKIFLFFGLLFIYLLCINFFTPLYADDYGRSLALTGLGQLWHEVTKTYFAWGGRLAVYFFTFLFLWKNTAALYVFNLLNSLCLVFLIYLIFLHAYAKQLQNFADLIRLFIIFNLVWFLPTAIGEVSFWKTGAIGYLWVLTANLALLYPWMRLILDKVNVVSSHRLISILLFLASLIVGTCLENVSAAISAFFIGSMVYLKYQQRRIPPWAYYVSIGYVIGTILLIIAPGNFHRIATISQEYSRFYQLAYLTFRIVVRLLPFAGVFGVIVVILRTAKIPITPMQWKRFGLFMGLAGLAAYAMMGIPHAVWFNGRNAFASDIFAIVALASLLPTQITTSMKRLVFLILLPLCLLDMANVFIFYHTRFVEDQMRRAAVAENLSRNNKNIDLPTIAPSGINAWLAKFSAYRLFYRDLESDPKCWINQSMAQYYHVSSVRINSELRN